jgi:hypothetical protein
MIKKSKYYYKFNNKKIYINQSYSFNSKFSFSFSSGSLSLLLSSDDVKV